MVFKELIFHSFYFWGCVVRFFTFSTFEGYAGLTRTDFNSFYLAGGGGVERTDFSTVSILGGCGGLEKTDF